MARYVDVEKIFPNGVFYMNKNHPEDSLTELINHICNLPTTDVVEVVRCKYCKNYKPQTKSAHWNSEKGYCCRCATVKVSGNDFCSYGERGTGMTCKDCIHFVMCIDRHLYEKDSIVSCEDFKNKSDYAEVKCRCSECKHLKIINKAPVYAECERQKLTFLLWQADTREHTCSYGERRTDNE